MMNFFQIQLLFLLGETIIALAVCLYSGIALRRAREKRLRHIQVWLLPFFVGNLLGTANLLIHDYHFVTGTRPAMLVWLVRMIHNTPASKNESVAGIELDSNKEAPWPPPPNTPPV